jgi:basic membrane protein A
MLKKVDVAVYQSIVLETKNQFQGGTFDLGLAEDGVGYSLDQFNRELLTPEMEKQVDSIKSQILKKQIHVPDFYLQMKKVKPS